MLFNSLGFLLFLVGVLAFYYTNILSWKGKKMMLLIASYIFYGLWNPFLVILLWISTLVDWYAGNQLSVEENHKKRKLWLLLSLVVNLGFLAFFKYGNFLLENFILAAGSLGMTYEPLPMDIILPMGISFYTFQTMSYTIDIYNKNGEPAKSFLDFALYVTFFPQLVAGPIVRAKELVTQFYEPKKANLDQFIWGTFLLTLGLFLKIVMADTLLSETSDTIFNSGAVLTSLDAWTGTLAFSGQIFFDFAGYSTCAIGIALMLGIILPDNFRYPYGAIGFSDFWKRWHISLSTWLRDYLYIPLGGNKFGITRLYAALLITMLLGGLWHGAAWTFVVWGALHGFYLIVERLMRNKIHIKINALTGFLLALGTYILVNFTWVFFRATDFTVAQNILFSMIFLNEQEGVMLLQYFDIIKVFTLIAITFVIHWLMRNTSVKTEAEKISPMMLGTIWGSMLFLIAISQSTGEQFIYFQF